ncbi:hypothetical protein WAX74_17440 [Psychrobacillus sp. FJAT-51614]|uniref:Type II secretion system protein n=1 Tax=Psychrobacillus mangrovi TaxID=3117745 RepID=A0ABU8F8S2_9BACI
MINSKGFSWPETIVALSVIFLIATTLLPLLSNMVVLLEEKKRKYHSSVVIKEGVKMYIEENLLDGSMRIDEIEYTFSIDGQQICVNYEGMTEEKMNCLSISY